jgi:hypothetical protein
VQHRPAAKARDARQFEAVGAAVRHCNFDGLRKLRRHPLVGIDRQNPVAGRKRQREILLRPKAPPFVLLDPRPLAARDLHGSVGRAAVDNDALVAKAKPVETVTDIRRFVAGDDDRGELRHGG